MGWFKLLKQPKLITGSKITTTLGSDSKEDEEGPCFKKLKEYQEKIAGKTYIMDKNIKMHVKHNLKYMPEEVACAALKLLNVAKLANGANKQRRRSINFVTLNVDGTEYHVETYWYYDFSKTSFRVTMELEVYTPEPLNVNLYFKVSVRNTTLDNLTPDKIIEYHSDMVNWRDNY